MKQYMRVLDVVDALVAVWNRVVKRVPAPFLNCDRAAKGNDLRKLGVSYGKAFTIAFGAAAHTHYTHYIAHHLHEQVKKVHDHGLLWAGRRALRQGAEATCAAHRQEWRWEKR